jgi:hypothetical protein
MDYSLSSIWLMVLLARLIAMSLVLDGLIESTLVMKADDSSRGSVPSIRASNSSSILSLSGKVS